VHSINNGQVSALILLHFSSAFDAVDHELLLSLLHNHFSVDHTALNWFHFYLPHCSKSSVYGGTETASYPVTCSVPGDSVLGPVEFIGYTDDLTSSFDQLHIPFQLFTDDRPVRISVRPLDVSDSHQHISVCVADIAGLVCLPPSTTERLKDGNCMVWVAC
jgi:Reverse transcriptase (RNA-dependent DNA polymerase)